MGRHFDTIIIGSGPAGCAVAGYLAERSDESIVLIEAGPDYGPLISDKWPADLLDASKLAQSHGWGYNSGTLYANRVLDWSRARVFGGCSSHNGCAAIWGHRADYDGWAALGNEGWSTDDLLPVFQDVSNRLRVRIPGEAEIQPFQRHFLESAINGGVPRVEDLNDLDDSIGVAPSPVNIDNGIRWNGALAFLDPVRHKTTLTIQGDSLVDRVEIERSIATGVHVVANGSSEFIHGDRVILAGGTYGSPAILLRSGIGPASDLAELNVALTVDLPGVGANLHDHPALDIPFAGSQLLNDEMNEFSASLWMPEEQVIAKTRSSYCTQAFDLHIYPVGGRESSKSDWQYTLNVSCMTPLSRGKLTLRSNDPKAAPVLEHGYLTDAGGRDAAVLLDGLKIAREIVGQRDHGAMMGAELDPGSAVTTDTALLTWIRENVGHYYHPVGTCKMGTSDDPQAVVGSSGQVHGVDGLFVADCSIMPEIPRANTNIPAAVVGARIASWL